MRIIVTLDDRNGMLFHRRRQSRDRNVTEDILRLCAGQTLYIRPFSAALFPGGAPVTIAEDCLAAAGEKDWCFIEDLPLSPVKDRISTLVVYRWNRVYPQDTGLDLSLSGFSLAQTAEFPGFSHDKITREVYTNAAISR